MAEAKKGTPNFRWSTTLSEFAIKYLADLANEGLKVDKAFKNTAYVKTADAVNTHFKLKEPIDSSKVVGHYRTIKRWWDVIEAARNLSGNGNYFDDTTYTIGMDADTAREYIAAHPQAERWINRPIPLYKEMQLICGNDRATGEYMATSSGHFGLTQPGPGSVASDVPIDLDNDEVIAEEEAINVNEVSELTPSVTSKGNKTLKSKKRVRDEDDELSENLKGIASGVHRYADLLEKTLTTPAARPDHLDEKKIYADVFSLEEKGFTEDELYDIYTHLIKDEKDAKIFMGAQERIRLKWVNAFLNDSRSAYIPAYDPDPF